MSRVQRTYHQLPQSEAPEPLSAPVYTQMLESKTNGLINHERWLSTIAPTDLCAYSDGSSEGPGRSSWGFALQRGGITFRKGHGVLYGGEVYDAEIFGATMGLREALSERNNDEKIYVLLHN